MKKIIRKTHKKVHLGHRFNREDSLIQMYVADEKQRLGAERAAGVVWPTEPPHLDREEIVTYLSQIHRPEADPVIVHLDGCATCTARVADVYREFKQQPFLARIRERFSLPFRHALSLLTNNEPQLYIQFSGHGISLIDTPGLGSGELGEEGSSDGIKWYLSGLPDNRYELNLRTDNTDWFKKIVWVRLAEERSDAGTERGLFIALRRATATSAVGRAVLPNNLKWMPGFVAAPADEMIPEFVPTIAASLALARRYDPTALSLWQSWLNDLPESVRAVVSKMDEPHSGSGVHKRSWQDTIVHGYDKLAKYGEAYFIARRDHVIYASQSGDEPIHDFVLIEDLNRDRLAAVEKEVTGLLDEANRLLTQNQLKLALERRLSATNLWYQADSKPNWLFALCLNNVGHSYDSLGDVATGLQYHQRALAMYQRLFGGDHPDVAMSLNNVGASFEALGDVATGLAYQLQALSMRQRLFGGDHPDVAMSLNNVGASYEALGDVARGLEYLRQALSMRQRLFDGDHPQVANGLNNVGYSYEALGDVARGLEYKQQALAMYQRLFKGDHPDMAMSLNNVGASYQALGDLQKSLEYFQRALEMYQRLYPGDHPDVARSLSNVGIAYEALANVVRVDPKKWFEVVEPTRTWDVIVAVPQAPGETVAFDFGTVTRHGDSLDIRYRTEDDTVRQHIVHLLVLRPEPDSGAHRQIATGAGRIAIGFTDAESTPVNGFDRTITLSEDALSEDGDDLYLGISIPTQSSIILKTLGKFGINWAISRNEGRAFAVRSGNAEGNDTVEVGSRRVQGIEMRLIWQRSRNVLWLKATAENEELLGRTVIFTVAVQEPEAPDQTCPEWIWEEAFVFTQTGDTSGFKAEVRFPAGQITDTQINGRLALRFAEDRPARMPVDGENRK